MAAPTDTTPDPRLSLRPEVTVAYADHRLTADWPAVPAAFAYHVEVSDQTGATVYVSDVDAASYARPVVLGSEAFAPVPGSTYTVAVSVRGMPSPPASVTAVDLQQPAAVVTAFVAGGVRLAWTAVLDATAYDVRVSAADGAAVVARDGLTALTADVGLADGLALDTPYTAEVRARAGAAYGPWSAPAAVQLPSARAILAALRDRLVAARAQAQPTGPASYPLDATTLPPGATGNPARVLGLLTAALANPAVGGALAVTSETGPVLGDGGTSLTLAGTAGVLSGPDDPHPTTVVLTVSDDFELEATWTTTVPETWRLSDTYPVLAGSPYQYLRLRDITCCATTWPRQDPGFYFPLGVGLHYQATLTIRSSLLPATGPATGDADPDALTVRVGGAVDVSPDGRPQFAWTGETPVGPLSVARVGQPVLAVTGAVAQLSSTRTVDPGTNDNRLVLAGRFDLGGQAVPGVLDLPTTATPGLTLAASVPGSVPSTADALALVGVDDVLAARLPSTLLDLTGVTVTSYRLTFDPAGLAPTGTSVTFGFGTGEWRLLDTPALRVTGLELAATVSRGRSYLPSPYTSYSAEVRGRLGIGGASHAVRAGVPLRGPWYVEVEDAGAAPALADLADLADLAGLSEGQVTGVLPRSLVDPGSAVAVSRVALAVDPAAPRLVEVDLTIAQTGSWPVAGGAVKLSGWSVDLRLRRATDPEGGWQVGGVVHGSIGLTSGTAATTTFDVELAVPPGPDLLWTVALAEGQAVHLPTVRQILDLLGGSAIPLPAGLATLGDLDLTLLRLSLDPAALALRHVAFAFAQAATWQVIPGALEVSKLSAAFALQPATTPVGVSGHLHGLLTVAGSPVDVQAVKNGFGGGWTLTAGVENRVHVPGFAALDAWLAPDAASGYLPVTLPLADGFDVGPVVLRFDAVTGALSAIGFTLTAADVWSVVPDALALTDVRAEVLVPYPVVASEVTGGVSGVLTLAGAHLLLTASKPAVEAPWELTGSLLAGARLDLLAAARAVARSADLALPADITEYGFPATVTVVAADLRVIPDTGLFHLAGQLGFDWGFSFGPAGTLSIRSVSATLDVPAAGQPLTATVHGRLSVAGLDVDLGLRIGGEDAHTVLTGAVGPQAAGQIRVDELADDLAATGTGDSWATVVPTDLVPLAFTDAAISLDLTGPAFLAAGSMTYGGAPALSGLLYVERCPPAGDRQGGDEPRWSCAGVLALGSGFRFGDLVPALSPVDGVLRVTDGRLIVVAHADDTLGDLATRVGTALHSLAPQAVSPLDGLAAEATALATGAYLVARLDFGPVTLFSRILQIGEDATAPAVLLSALIDRGDPTRTTFAADLPDITIAGTILLTHDDTHTGIHLAYTPADASRFTLDGRVALRQVFGTDLAFDVSLRVDDGGLTTAIRQTGQAIEQPFGIPGITLSGLGLDIAYTWARPATGTTPAAPRSSRVAVRGHALLGPAPAPGGTDDRLSVAGTLALRDGTPVLLYLAIDRDFSIARFVAQCLAGPGSTWPAAFLDLTFLGGSRISYYNATADPGGDLATYDGFTFVDGFAVDARIRLTLVVELTLHTVLTVLRDAATGDYTGVRAAIVLDDPVDLVFATLAGAAGAGGDGAYLGGPTLAVQTGTATQFALATGINFLGSPFVHVDVAVAKGQPSGTVFTGDLVAAQPLAPFGQLRCRFRYETDPGRFTIEDWPSFQWLRDLVDFVGAIRDLCDMAERSACGQLASLIVQHAFATSFSLSPSVSSAGDNLVFSFTGSYSMTALGADSPFLTATLPPLAVPVPKTATWPDLPEAIARGIGSAAGQFARDLLADPAQAALFLGMVFGPAALSLALELACNGLVDGAVAAAADAAAGAMAAAGGPAAAGAAGAASAAALASLADSSGHQPDSGDTPPGDPEPPAIKRVGYRAGAVTADWDAARNASGYTFEVLRPDGTSLGTQSYGYVLSGQLAVDAAALAPGAYQARVRSTRGASASGWSALPIAKPAPPAATLGYRGGALTLGWTHGGADGYTAELADPDGRPIADIQTGGGQRAATTPLPEPVAGAYTGRVRATLAGQLPGDWSPTATLVVLSLPVPVVTAARHTAEDDTITLDWAPGAAELAYLVAARSPGGATVVTATTAAGAAGATLPAPAGGWIPGTTYTLALRAIGVDAVSPWATRDVTVVAVPVPGPVTAATAASRLLVSWTAVEPPAGAALTYDVAGYDATAPESPIGEVQGLTATSTELVLSGRTPAEGDRYLLRVRAVIGDNIGAWSAASTFDVHLLPPPAAVILAPAWPPSGSPSAGPELSASWVPPVLPAALTGDPITYVARLDLDTAAGWAEAGQATVVAATGIALARADGGTPATGERYRARVQAAVPSYTSDWGRSDPVTVLDTLVVSRLGYAAGQVDADWSVSAVAGAAYQAILTPPGGQPVTITVPPPAGPTGHASFDLADLPRGVTYLLAVRAVAPDGTLGPPGTPVPVPVVDPPAAVKVTHGRATLWRVAWASAPGATAYRVTIADPAGSPVSRTKVGPAPRTVDIDMAPYPHGVPLTADVSTLMGDDASVPSAPVSFVVLDPPAGVIATADAATVTVTWQPVTGAGSYEVVLTDAGGQPAASQTVATAPARLPATGLPAGATYTVVVRALAGGTGPWSAPVPVTIPAGQPTGYTCLCLGVSPGKSCGNGGVGDDFTGVFRGITASKLDGGFAPNRTGSRTGWVAVPQMSWAGASVLVQLVAVLASKGVLTGTEPFDVFDRPTPGNVRTGTGGEVTCLCLGVSPGGGCGNGGPGDDFGGVYRNVTQSDLDTLFQPDRTPTRTGWVAVPQQPYLPLSVLLQLVRMLAGKGTLTGDEPYDVFNKAITASVREGSGGDQMCACLGNPPGQGATTIPGECGDVAVNLIAAEVAGRYAPGPGSGWVTLAQTDYAVLSATLRLVALLTAKGVLADDEPYHVFNQATPIHVR